MTHDELQQDARDEEELFHNEILKESHLLTPRQGKQAESRGFRETSQSNGRSGSELHEDDEETEKIAVVEPFSRRREEGRLKHVIFTQSSAMSKAGSEECSNDKGV